MNQLTIGDWLCGYLLFYIALRWGIVVVRFVKKIVRRRPVPLSKEEGDKIFAYRVRLDGDRTRFGEGLKGMTHDVKEVVMGR